MWNNYEQERRLTRHSYRETYKSIEWPVWCYWSKCPPNVNYTGWAYTVYSQCQSADHWVLLCRYVLGLLFLLFFGVRLPPLMWTATPSLPLTHFLQFSNPLHKLLSVCIHPSVSFYCPFFFFTLPSSIYVSTANGGQTCLPLSTALLISSLPLSLFHSPLLSFPSLLLDSQGGIDSMWSTPPSSPPSAHVISITLCNCSRCHPSPPHVSSLVLPGSQCAGSTVCVCLCSDFSPYTLNSAAGFVTHVLSFALPPIFPSVLPESNISSMWLVFTPSQLHFPLQKPTERETQTVWLIYLITASISPTCRKH